MRTLQSPRGHWARYNADPGNHARRRAIVDAARIAGPSPIYPPMAPITGDWLGGRINGHTVIVRLMRNQKHRSDQWAAEVDGEVVAQAAGLTDLWRLLKGRFPRALSRRELANLEA